MKTIQFVLSILVSICAAGMLYGAITTYECYMCRVCVAHENNL